MENRDERPREINAQLGQGPTEGVNQSKLTTPLRIVTVNGQEVAVCITGPTVNGKIPVRVLDEDGEMKGEVFQIPVPQNPIGHNLRLGELSGLGNGEGAPAEMLERMVRQANAKRIEPPTEPLYRSRLTYYNFKEWAPVCQQHGARLGPCGIDDGEAYFVDDYDNTVALWHVGTECRTVSSQLCARRAGSCRASEIALQIGRGAIE